MKLLLQTIVLIQCCLCSLSLKSQATIQDPVPFPKNYYNHPIFSKAREYSKALDWGNAEKYWIEFSLRYPAERPSYLELGSVKIGLKKYQEAEFLLQKAYLMNPIDIRTIGEYIMICAINNNASKAKSLSSQLAKLSTTENFTFYNDYFTNQINRYNGATKTVLINVKKNYREEYNRIGSFDKYSIVLKKVARKKGKSWDEIMTNLKSLKKPLKERGVVSGAYQWLVKDMYDYVKYKFGLNNVVGKELIKIMISEYKNDKSINPYFKVIFGNQQYIQYMGADDYERSYALNSLLIEHVSKDNKYRYELIDLYMNRAKLLYQMSRFKEFNKVSMSLTQILKDYKNPLFIAEGYESIALMNSRDGDMDKGIDYALKALTIIQKNKLDGEKRVKSLLTIIYSNQGNVELALKYSGFGKDQEDYMAQYNIASILEENERYKEAINYYNKALNNFNQRLTRANTQQKLTMLSKMNPLYGGLAFSYLKQNKHEKAFETIEQSKTRLLAKAIGLKESSEVNHLQVQAKLASDEVYVSYKMNGKAGFLVSIVTKKKVVTGAFNMKNLIKPLKKHFSTELKKLDKELAKKEYRSSEYVEVNSSIKESKIPINHGDFELVVELYRKYLTGKLGDYIKVAPEMRNKIGNTISNSFFNTFFGILNEQLDGQKKMIISVDGALNFIPFETLKNKEGRYIANLYEIKMVPSAAIWLKLKSRNYSSSRKEIIAFGGAIYEEALSNAKLVSSYKEINEWQLRSYELVDQGKPLTDMYKALGYSKMNYLKGTLQEVKDIGEIYAGSSKIVTGKDMTEKKLKTLSMKGELQTYKVIHFATHGWASSSMPKTSGLAMCIPKKSLDGEDGRLVAKELSELKLRADMVMLSACETGLGKLYGGEGVSGLNQSLLIAGANSTIVSLWPVNDYATSILVKELYRLVKEKRISHSEALLEVKRNFIQGKYNNEHGNFQSPVYWAAFIYNGK